MRGGGTMATATESMSLADEIRAYMHDDDETIEWTNCDDWRERAPGLHARA